MGDKRIAVASGVDAEQVTGFEATVRLDGEKISHPCGHTHGSRREAQLCGRQVLQRLLAKKQ